MKIEINVTKKNMAFAVVFAAFSALGHFAFGISAINACAFMLLYGIVQNLEIEWNEKYGGIWTAAAIAVAGALTTWLVQYLLLEEELRGKLFGGAAVLNICCSLVVIWRF